MKFGKQLECQALPKFRGHYIAYDELKKAFEVATGQAKDSATVQQVTHWSSSFLRLGPNPELPPEAHAQELLGHELDRISKFAGIEEDSLKAKIASLEADSKSDAADVAGLKHMMEEQGEMLVDLNSFAQLNCTGFRKILKKYDKWSSKTISPWFLAMVARSRLMSLDTEGMLQTISRVAHVVRRRAVQVSAGAGQISRCPSYVEGVHFGSEGSRKVIFLVEKQDTLKVRMELAKSLTARNCSAPQPASQVSIQEQRLRLTTSYMDSAGFEVYRSFTTAAEGTRPAVSAHFRQRAGGEGVVCLVHETPESAECAELLLVPGEAEALKNGGLPANVVAPNSVGSSAVAGVTAGVTINTKTVPFSEARKTFLAVQRLVQTGAKPVVQASFTRSVYTDDNASGGSGFAAILDEDVVFEEPNAAKESKTQTKRLQFNILTVMAPPGPGLKEMPPWLHVIYESLRVFEVGGFSKASFAIASFHAKKFGLPMPSWYRNVTKGSSSSDADEQSDASDGAKPVGPSDKPKPEGPVVNRSASRLLHEFGTSPGAETSARLRAASSIGGPMRAPAPDGGGLGASLLVGAQAENSADPEAGGMFSVVSSWIHTRKVDTTSRNLPVRNAIVTVQPKTLFSNERTFLEWIHFATIIAAMGVFLLHSSGQVGHIILGRFLVLFSVCVIFWSQHTFSWRARALDSKQAIGYHDAVGPGLLMFALMAAMVFVWLHAAGIIEFDNNNNNIAVRDMPLSTMPPSTTFMDHRAYKTNDDPAVYTKNDDHRAYRENDENVDSKTKKRVKGGKKGKKGKKGYKNKKGNNR